MAEHARDTRDKKKSEKVPGIKRPKQEVVGPSEEEPTPPNTDILNETPFYPRLEEHAEILSRMPPSSERNRLIMRLNQTYGNTYVQSLIASLKVQKTASEEIETGISGARGSGQPLPEKVRGPMEQAFDEDFSGVRVHTDNAADNLNKQLDASAFATGRDVFFRSGEYDPESESGQKLLAHELQHTVQPGADNRIARWLPKGHELITNSAMAEHKKSYSKKVQKLLAGLSQDLDVKDYSYMSSGRSASKGLLKKYKKDKKENPMQAEADYYNNVFHVRDTDYMERHGEGAQYKDSKLGQGPTINLAKTKDMLADAVKSWREDDRKTSLDKLGDALHQAEDRGAHEEGEPYKGHDERVEMNETAWEKEHYKPGWKASEDTDNISKNPQGAAMAKAHAIALLGEFVEGTGEKKIDITGKEKPERATRWGQGARSKLVAPFLGSTGIKNMKQLDKIIENVLKSDTNKEDYEEALAELKNKPLEEFRMFPLDQLQLYYKDAIEGMALREHILEEEGL